ncbi:MAG: ribonuclease D [Pseudomonadota bacterium]
MIEINETAALAAFCAKAAEHPYVTVDTEFLRERTYYPKLCLVQLAFPGGGEGDAAIVDPLGGELDLAPLDALLADPSVVKVFHAARQDIEIFWHRNAAVPAPLFDTQVAAMVCGFGEQVGYETLVRKIARTDLDKSSRFTDWSRRPLTDAQKTYALADVTHLRQIYETLSQRLTESGRTAWVEEEMAILTDPDTYQVVPEEAWRRLKTRSNSGRFLAIVRALAAFREREAQSRDVPRNRILKDDALLELASLKPRTPQELGRARLLLREARKGATADGLLAAVAEGMACPDNALPAVAPQRPQRSGSQALSDLLKVLLKARADQAGVAQKLIATSADLEDLANGADGDLLVLKGWRREIFGEDALALRRGEIALAASKGGVRIHRL